MSGKNQAPITFNFQSANPITTLRPISNQNGSGGSVPSGTVAGTMSSTNTIYSNIIDVSRIDNIGLEIAWTSTAVGTISILVSSSGINFNALTFSPVLAQPAGSAGGYAVSLNQIPFKYMLIKYVNASGSGALTVYGQIKDLN